LITKKFCSFYEILRPLCGRALGPNPWLTNFDLSEIMPSKDPDRRAVKVCLLGLLALEGRPQRGRRIFIYLFLI